MRIVCISDTHGQHRSLGRLTAGDVLIHAGDATMMGEERTVIDFNEWLREQPFKHKLFVPGNHDLCFATHPETRGLITNAQMLVHEMIEIDGRKFFGSPYTPHFGRPIWQFTFPRIRMAEYWASCPSGVDVLITHGPPQGFLDYVGGEFVGDAALHDYVKYRALPTLHVFGHIHEGYGTHDAFWGKLVNASVLNGRYCLTNAPICVTMFEDEQDGWKNQPDGAIA